MYLFQFFTPGWLLTSTLSRVLRQRDPVSKDSFVRYASNPVRQKLFVNRGDKSTWSVMLDAAGTIANWDRG